tara:strand:+ start:1566 stop:2081 length:516 start_codon:yes stop_codon:yes gene_type:complete
VKKVSNKVKIGIWVFIIVAILAYNFSPKIIRAINTSFIWKETSGVLLDVSKWNEFRKGYDSFLLGVKYKYTLDEIEYKSDKYDIAGNFNSGIESKRDEIYNELNQIMNSEVVIYFDPKNPADSVLSKGENEDITVGLTIFLVFIVMGFFLIHSLRKQKDQSNQLPPLKPLS